MRWFDNHAADGSLDPEAAQRVDWRRCVPFLGLHAACLGVFWVGWSAAALWAAAGLYASSRSREPFRALMGALGLFGLMLVPATFP